MRSVVKSYFIRLPKVLFHNLERDEFHKYFIRAVCMYVLENNFKISHTSILETLNFSTINFKITRLHVYHFLVSL